ncbi:polyprenyl synthetase family protein [Kitasatospora albolonga]|uniref:polyprenyl synthetase family protein n=1 Tax=Kitasatospora albolonga TaxID=68173 RepID=UPI0031F0AF22
MALPMPVPPPSHELDLPSLRVAVEETLTAFLAEKARTITEGGRLPDLVRPLQDFLTAGGKRLRPLLAMLGWHAAGAPGGPAAALHLAASLELFHAFCLIHDDVMDHSATRRNRPTVQALHSSQHPPGTPAADRFGEGATILVGDLAMFWSQELLHAMRTELTLGQYLDLTHGGSTDPSIDTAMTIVRYKTAKYTVERPLQLGAALAGADHALLRSLSDFAIPLGEAFQLRDDLLGVFGDPAVTGKRVIDDLREGKATVLIALTLQRATPTQATRLHLLPGRPDLTDAQAESARRIIAATGADRAANDMAPGAVNFLLYSGSRGVMRGARAPSPDLNVVDAPGPQLNKRHQPCCRPRKADDRGGTTDLVVPPRP